MVEEIVGGYLETDPDGLDDLVRRNELSARAAQARQSLALAVTEATGTWDRDGHASMRAYLSATFNWPSAEVSRQIRLARLLDRHPTVAEALLAGHIGVPQATLLARVHANPRVRELLGAAMPTLLDHAEHLPYDDFKVCVDRWVMLADLEGSYADVERSVENRTARVTAIDSTIDIAASGGDALSAEAFVSIFESFCEAEFHADVAARREHYGDDAAEHPLPRTAAQRRFDALVAIFNGAYEADPASGTAPEPLVNIVCDDRTAGDVFLRGGLILPNGAQLDVDDFEPADVRSVLDALVDDAADLVDRRCETRSGIPVHPILLLQAAMTGHIRRVVLDSAGTTIDYGRTQRLFTGNARLAATLLSRHCSHLGCRVPARRCDVDHMDEWVADSGPTDQRNADVRCGRHDRFKHRERWRSRRSSGGRVYNLRPDGTFVLPVGERPPDIDEREAARAVMRRLMADLERHRAS